MKGLGSDSPLWSAWCKRSSAMRPDERVLRIALVLANMLQEDTKYKVEGVIALNPDDFTAGWRPNWTSLVNFCGYAIESPAEGLTLSDQVAAMIINKMPDGPERKRLLEVLGIS